MCAIQRQQYLRPFDYPMPTSSKLVLNWFQMTDFLEGNYLQEQVRSIKEIGDYITNLKRVGPGLGEYMFDKETLSE